MVEACLTCQCHHPQEPRQPLQPTLAPECPWQYLGADFFTFVGFEYLVIINYYTKMPFIRKIPPSQYNAAKTIALLKEMFSEHGIPETVRSDNGPQFASHQFAELTKEWNFDHITSSPRNPRSNGQAEVAVKVTKGLLTHAKYSGQGPYLALLAYRSTPIDAHLHSPAEMLYQRAIHTTVLQGIRQKDPQATADQDHLNDCATQSAAYHDRHCKQKSPLYAGQTVSILNDAKTLWLLATVIHQAKHGSYLVQVIGGGQYRCACDHIRECHPDAVKPDRSTITDVAPATHECSPGMPPVRPAPAVPAATSVAQATNSPNLVAPTTKPHTPRKSVVHTPQRPQNPFIGDVPRLVQHLLPTHQSTRVRKAPNPAS